MRSIFYLLYPYFAYYWDSMVARLTKLNHPKVFCIGLNKTGTTSLELALSQMGYKMGVQRKGELLLTDWINKDYKRLLKFCETAEAFQDAPFSLPNTYKILEQAFPDAKFILSVRDSPEQWYNSLTRFHSKLFADGSRIPTTEDLKNASYISKGRLHKTLPLIFGTPPTDPYNKGILLKYYTHHLQDVQDYFADKPSKLLVINVAKKEDYYQLCQFLEQEPIGSNFPWLNKTLTPN